MPATITIEILTKADCCLCDDAKEIIEGVIGDYPAILQITDIETDADLFEQYKERIPVVRINGKESLSIRYTRSPYVKNWKKFYARPD